MRKLLLSLCLISLSCSAQTTTSPNMSLPIPVVGSTPGPAWANAINASLNLIDAHDHSPGYGVQITPSGINISSTLNFQNHTASNVQATVYQAQSSLGAELSTYVVGADLYYNDGNGNVIQITSGGNVAGSAGTITGLPSGTAGAAYSAGTFTFTSASLTGANIDGASFVLRNNTASSKGLTLKPPTAMAANIQETLPTIPASTNFMAIDSSGGMSAYAAVANGITRSNLASVGQQVSSSSGTFTSSSTSLVAVTNLTVTITTSGRPVMLLVQSDGSGNNAVFGASNSTATSWTWVYTLNRGATEIARVLCGNYPTVNQSTFSGLPHMLDTPTAGTYTYTVKVGLSTANTTISAQRLVLMAYEL